MKIDRKRLLFASLAAMFPGDVIHHKAPTTNAAAPSNVRVAVIDEAHLKRMRRLQRRAKQAAK